MKKQHLTILIALTLLVLLSACTTNSTLVDTSWQLTSLAGNPPIKDVEVKLNFSKDAIGGSDGCNSFGGSYEATKTSITFGNDIFSTEMYCSDEIAVQSNAFYESLTQAAAYTITNNSLSLIDENGIVLAEFVASQN